MRLFCDMEAQCASTGKASKLFCTDQLHGADSFLRDL